MATYEIIRNDGTQLVVRELNSMEGEQVLTMYENTGRKEVTLYDTNNTIWETNLGLCEPSDYKVGSLFQVINTTPEPHK